MEILNSPLLAIIFFSFCLSILIAVFLIYIFKKNPEYHRKLSCSEKQGIEGENMVSDALKSLIKEKGGYLYNNVCVLNKETSIEIDHVLVTRAGLFVIETKTIHGAIIGKEDDKNWVVKKKSGGHFEIFNPIIQNKNHIAHLRKLLKYPNVKIYSIIVFPVGDISRLYCNNVYTLKTAVNVIKSLLTTLYDESFVEKLNHDIEYISWYYSIDKKTHVRNCHELGKRVNK